MSGRRIYAGYYRRHNGKVVYVISLATDADTGEEMVIWTTYPFAAVPRYYISSKKSFCAFIEVNGERKAKYKRLLNMKISGEGIERLEEEGFRGRARKRKNRQLDEAGVQVILLCSLNQTVFGSSGNSPMVDFTGSEHQIGNHLYGMCFLKKNFGCLCTKKSRGMRLAPSIPGPVLDFWPDVVLNIQHRVGDRCRE